MRTYRLITVVMILLGCVPSKRPALPHYQYLSDIIETRDLYLTAIEEFQDADGFLFGDDCDSLLFSGLIKASGAKVNLTAARDRVTGQWFRTPAKDCYRASLSGGEEVASPGGSGSDISRDMLIGAMWGLYFSNDKGSLLHIIEYGRAHDWVMGRGSLDRTYFSPIFQDTLYRIAGKEYDGPPYVWVDPVKDHHRHITALNIILRGEAQGKIDKEMLGMLEHFEREDPLNALFTYGAARFSDGDQTDTINILRNTNLFPKNGPLKERCVRWAWEQHSDLQTGCKSMSPASGGDFLFIAALLERAQIQGSY